MIASISGQVVAASTNALVIDCSGVGYLVHVPPQTATAHRVGENASLHTRLIVREDSMTLYGFDDAESAALFDAVTSVSGIGPKSGLAIIATLSTDQIADAVASENDAVFRSVPGIGPKTAKLLVVSLTGKVSGVSRSNSDVSNELVSALTGLGYSEKASIPAVAAALSQTQDKAAALRLALAKVSGGSLD